MRYIPAPHVQHVMVCVYMLVNALFVGLLMPRKSNKHTYLSAACAACAGLQ